MVTPLRWSKFNPTFIQTSHSAGVSKNEIASCGIGCPGVVDFSEGILKEAANLGWNDVNIGKYLSKKIGKNVVVLNDVDAGTFGEYHLGAAKGAYSVFGVFPGTGVGGGFVYDGKMKFLTILTFTISLITAAEANEISKAYLDSVEDLLENTKYKKKCLYALLAKGNKQYLYPLILDYF